MLITINIINTADFGRIVHLPWCDCCTTLIGSKKVSWCLVLSALTNCFNFLRYLGILQRLSAAGDQIMVAISISISMSIAAPVPSSVAMAISISVTIAFNYFAWSINYV